MKLLLTATVQSHIVQFHRPLVDMLHAHGCEVHVAAKDNLAEKNGLTLDFADKVFDVPFARSPKSPDNLRAYRQIKDIIQAERYDVIHCNTPMGGIVTRLAAGKARKTGTRVFYTAHGFHFYKGAPKKNWIIYYPIEKFFARFFTDKLITITQEDYDLARRKFACQVERIHGVGVDENRYYPVDEAEKQKLRVEMGFRPEQKIILCVGELLPNKNQVMAIRMMRLLIQTYPDAMLLIAGNGPEKEHIEQEIATCGVENNVRLLGYCTHLQDYQHLADVSVSCSYREGLPLNIVEAMLSGTPVVATDNRGHRELIRSGETGYLVAVDDVDAMTGCVHVLLSTDDKRNAICRSALALSRGYSFEKIKEELVGIYSLFNVGV